MSLANFIEQRISEAIEAGEFDNLEGAGKPLNRNFVHRRGRNARAVSASAFFAAA